MPSLYRLIIAKLLLTKAIYTLLASADRDSLATLGAFLKVSPVLFRVTNPSYDLIARASDKPSVTSQPQVSSVLLFYFHESVERKHVRWKQHHDRSLTEQSG